MIPEHTNYKLVEIIHDTWPKLYWLNISHISPLESVDGVKITKRQTLDEVSQVT
jgi:hypothetical protein